MHRTQRMYPDPEGTVEALDGESPFRLDLERLRFSPYFARLSSVTQVIGQTGAGPLIHNRLTHSMKVTAVARSIAVDIEQRLTEAGPLPAEYVCDAIVAQAAATAHDLGHPPFGHLGETVLDRLAREFLGLADGFEGNAQTYRIVASLDVCHGSPHGLNLTAASRSAVAKYPWTPAVDVSSLPEGLVPPGLRWIDGELVVRKFSAYFVEAADLAAAREHAHGVLPLQQSLEGSVMDIADDIAYSIHDVDDFHRAGLLGHGAVALEFREWSEHAAELMHLDDADLFTTTRPGTALERLRRKQQADDPWVADDDAFVDAVRTVSEDLVDGLLAQSFNGSIASERALSSFTSRWIHHLQTSVHLAPADNIRTGLVTLSKQAWHEVEILKFVHRQFVLSRSDVAMYQRGLSRVLTRAVKGLKAWLEDPHDKYRVPLRLQELVDLATHEYVELARNRPDGIPPVRSEDVRRLGLGRGILDYVASLSDAQAIAVSEALDGRPDKLWDIGQAL